MASSHCEPALQMSYSSLKPSKLADDFLGMNSWQRKSRAAANSAKNPMHPPECGDRESFSYVDICLGGSTKFPFRSIRNKKSSIFVAAVRSLFRFKNFFAFSCSRFVQVSKSSGSNLPDSFHILDPYLLGSR